MKHENKNKPLKTKHNNTIFLKKESEAPRILY